MLDETIRQFEKEIMVMAVNPIPKWWVSMVLPYGLLGAAFYFLRQFLDEFGSQQSPT
jgi:TRAP-type C4-dicarboxylate transport system permease small subunit